MKKLAGLTFLLGILVLIFFTSCEDENDTPPAYVGVWEMLSTDSIGDTEVDMKQMLTLHEDSFETIVSMLPDDQPAIDVMGMKGDLDMDGDNGTITFTSYGKQQYDNSANPTGMVWYEEGDTEFNKFITDDMDGKKTQNIKISVDGDKLNIKIDQNNNGSFDDEEDENQIFDKVVE